jgi:glycosyltransferase involved in cell wall biosynthesis
VRPIRSLHVGANLLVSPPRADDTFAPERTDTAQQVRRLLPALVAAGHQVHLVTSGTPGSEDVAIRDAGVGVTRVGGGPRRRLPIGRVLGEASRRARWSDVIHVHLDESATLPTAGLMDLVTARPIIVHLHSSRGVPLRSGQRASLWGRLVEATLETRSLARASAVVTSSTPLAVVARSAGANNVVVVPSLADAPCARNLDRPPIDDHEGLRVVSVGPLVRRRRPLALVEAMTLQPLESNLYLLGDGPMRSAVDQRARELGLGGRVHVIPRVLWRTACDHLSSADAVVTAALIGEDSMAIRLARRFGRPIVASAIEDIPDLLSDGIDGVLVPPNDDVKLSAALRGVLMSRQRREELGASARRRAAASGWGEQARRIIEVQSAVLQALGHDVMVDPVR